MRLLTSGGWGYLIIRIRMPEISDRNRTRMLIILIAKISDNDIVETVYPVPAIKERVPIKNKTAGSENPRSSRRRSAVTLL